MRCAGLRIQRGGGLRFTIGRMAHGTIILVVGGLASSSRWSADKRGMGMGTKTVVARDDESSQRSSPILLRALQPMNLLSFGPDTPEIPLGPLNLLVGPNGAGKSNLIEAVCFLRASPKSIEEVVRKGGGVREWLWQGEADAVAFVSAAFRNPRWERPLQHTLVFAVENHSFAIVRESIFDKEELTPPGLENVYYLYKDVAGRIMFPKIGIEVDPNTFDHSASVLA